MTEQIPKERFERLADPVAAAPAPVAGDAASSGKRRGIVSLLLFAAIATGGGAAELTEAIEEHATARLNSVIASAGFMAITGEDEAFLTPTHLVPRLEVPVRDFALGDEVRCR